MSGLAVASALSTHPNVFTADALTRSSSSVVQRIVQSRATASSRPPAYFLFLGHPHPAYQLDRSVVPNNEQLQRLQSPLKVLWSAQSHAHMRAQDPKFQKKLREEFRSQNPEGYEQIMKDIRKINPNAGPESYLFMPDPRLPSEPEEYTVEPEVATDTGGAEMSSYCGPGQLIFSALLDLNAWPFNQVSNPKTIETTMGGFMADVLQTMYKGNGMATPKYRARSIWIKSQAFKGQERQIANMTRVEHFAEEAVLQMDVTVNVDVPVSGSEEVNPYARLRNLNIKAHPVTSIAAELGLTKYDVGSGFQGDGIQELQMQQIAMGILSSAPKLGLEAPGEGALNNSWEEVTGESPAKKQSWLRVITENAIIAAIISMFF